RSTSYWTSRVVLARVSSQRMLWAKWSCQVACPSGVRSLRCRFSTRARIARSPSLRTMTGTVARPACSAARRRSPCHEGVLPHSSHRWLASLQTYLPDHLYTVSTKSPCMRFVVHAPDEVGGEVGRRFGKFTETWSHDAKWLVIIFGLASWQKTWRGTCP